MNNRILKFRAWDNVKKEMMGEVWEIRFSNKHSDVENVVAGDRQSENFTLMQFTGLKDKNGKEIYESDYLGDWCVFWGSGKYILQNISSGDIIDCNEQNTQNKEITGNRFENPKEHSAMATDL